MAIKRTTSPRDGDEFYGLWNIEDTNWDLGQIAGEGRGDFGTGSGGISTLEVSVGVRKIPIFASSVSLPTVVLEDYQGRGTIGDFGEAPRQPPPPVPQELPPEFTSEPLSTSEGSDMSLDLGSIITGVAGSYFNAKYNPGQIVQQNVGVGSQPTYGTGGMDGSVIPTTPAVGVPFVDIIPEPPEGKGWLYRPATETCAGKWIKRSRRRRRNLVTNSDIKGIAALRTVGGPALVKTWIATHS